MPDLTPEERSRIYEEEKSRRDAEAAAPISSHPPLQKALLSALATVILLGGVGAFSYHEYQLHGLKQRLSEAIGKDLGLTETILRVESDSSKITFAELFDLCNKSVEQRTNLIVELRGLYPEIDFEFKSHLVEYLTAENEFVRAKRDYYRKVMEQNNVLESFKEQLSDTPASVYGWDYYRDRLRQEKAKALEAARNAEEGADEFLKAYETMSGKEQGIAKEAEYAGLRFSPIFQRHAGDNRKGAEGEKELAKKFASMF